MTTKHKSAWNWVLLALLVVAVVILLSCRAHAQADRISLPEFGTPSRVAAIIPGPGMPYLETLEYPYKPEWRAAELWEFQEAAFEVERDASVPLPDRKKTPGAVDSSLTKERLCNPKFHTGTVRNVSESTKKQVCAEYNQTRGCPGPGFEIDHLISIELGGSNDIRNLWPQPVDTATVIGFHTKDKLENQLHRMVCSGAITLPQAQKCIAKDWYACGKLANAIEERTK